MNLKKMSPAQISVLNIVACLIVVVINALISFFLSPFIVEHLGVEANGYVTLANSFVSYFALITVALNSMCGRFILIDFHKGDYESANEYYTSVLIGDFIIAAILLIPCVVFVAKLDDFLNVTGTLTGDIKILFALTFLNFFIGLCIPKWQVATYVRNRLYLRSLKTVISAFVRVLCIYIAFSFFKPAAYYVAIAGLAMTITNTICEALYKRKLTPQLKVKLSYYNFSKIKKLISSGIWNTVSSCGSLLLEGLDLLLANLFIDPVAMGVLSLSKILPNMMNQIVGSVATTFGPRLTQLFAEEKYTEIKKHTIQDMKIVSILSTIPIGLILVFGDVFFKLWVPSQNAKSLTILTGLTLLGLLFTGTSQCIINIFIAVNKLKVNSLVMIGSGLLNVLIVYVLLVTTDLGVYAIAGVSSVISIIRIFVFVAPYAAVCIYEKWYVFLWELLKAGLIVIIPMTVGIGVKTIIQPEGWLMLCVSIVASVIAAFLADGFLVLNKEERSMLASIIHKKKRKVIG